MVSQFINKNDHFVHQWMVEGPGYFKHWYSIVFTRCFGQFGPYAFLCPLADMANHSHAEECTFHFISEELHPKPDANKSYYSHDKYLCDVRLITGKPSDAAADKILKGSSVKNYAQKASPGSVE